MNDKIVAPPCNEEPDLSECYPDQNGANGDLTGNNGNGIPSGCIETPSGLKCPDTAPSAVCKPFQLTGNGDDCVIADYVEEALGIGGAVVNVYKLLGVHEQNQLVDQTGNGNAISSGDAPNFPATNAFNKLVSTWRSAQKGDRVTKAGFIGYDFGIIKLNNGRTRYGEPKDVTYDVATIRIKQLSNPNNRVTKARIERSQDGEKWYGVQVVDLPDCDQLVTVHFRRSVPSRYWRLRPVAFNGGNNDFWGVAALELINYEQTQIYNVQDRLFLENRNRDYQLPPISIKGSYDLIDNQTELSRFGIEIPSLSMYITISFNACVNAIGRPMVIGDVIELPSETQYSAELKPIKRYLEVTDVSWSTEGYTPGWGSTMLRIIAVPMLASQETQDIFGDLVGQVDETGLFDEDDGNHPLYQDYSEIAQTITEQATQEDKTPQRGRDSGNEITEFTEQQIQSVKQQTGADIRKVGLKPNALYVEDAIPPNGEDFTMGDTFPEDPSDGEYHRLTYSGLAEDVPDRLYRYSITKGRWIYLETDRRHEFDGTKKKLQEFITSPGSTPYDDITGNE